MDEVFGNIVSYIRKLFGTEEFIPLHEPRFIGNEKEYVLKTIESTFVSSVGEYVGEFEQKVAEFTGSPYAVAVVNGTSGLHLALQLAGVGYGDEVLTQPLTFIATGNAIKYLGAEPVFIDVARETMSLDPEKLFDFLRENAQVKEENGKQVCYNKQTGRKIAACVPMHTFGHAGEIDKIVEICNQFFIPVVEDAAESLGTFYKGKHTGTFGLMGVLSFNGNKIITTGSGGMILTADEKLAKLAKHLSTQAKVPHPWEYIHDYVGYNYRLTNLQAALGIAQMENLEFFIERKRWLAEKYAQFFDGIEDIDFVREPKNSKSNYWLNAILLKDLTIRNKFLKFTNDSGVMTRAAWKLLPDLEMFKSSQTYKIEIARELYNRLVNIPSSVILNTK